MALWKHQTAIRSTPRIQLDLIYGPGQERWWQIALGGPLVGQGPGRPIRTPSLLYALPARHSILPSSLLNLTSLATKRFLLEHPYMACAQRRH